MRSLPFDCKNHDVAALTTVWKAVHKLNHTLGGRFLAENVVVVLGVHFIIYTPAKRG